MMMKVSENFINRIEYFWLQYSKKTTITYIILSLLAGIISFSLIPMKELIIISIEDRNRVILFVLIYFLLLFFEYLVKQLVVDLSRRIKIQVEKNYQLELLNINKYNTCKDIENYNFQNDLERFSKLNDNIVTILSNYSSRIMNFVKFICILIIITRTKGLFLPVYLLLLLILVFAKLKQSKITFGFWKRYMENVRKANYFSKIQIDKEHAAERKLYSTLDFINKKFIAYFDIAKKDNKIAGKKRAYFDVLTEFVGIFVILISFMVWIPLLARNQISLGRFFILIESTITLQYLLSEELSKQNEFQEYINTQRDFYKYKSEIHLKKDIIDKDISEVYFKKICSSNNFDIKFENVTFGYSDDKKAIKNFSFTFRTYKNYVIVGENGTGKSTLCKLIMGLYNDYEGVITIGGIDIKKLKQEHRSLLVNMMFQTPVKLPLTIGDNITLKNVSKDDFESIDNAVYDKDLKDTINKMPNGWNTYVGELEENGIELSGGQWQKIFLGRVSYFYAPILILDEPASSLDPLSERKLYDRLKNHMNCTLNIIISHRLGVVKLADEILVLCDGELIESGNHEYLMDKGGKYFELYNSQKSLYERECEHII